MVFPYFEGKHLISRGSHPVQLLLYCSMPGVLFPNSTRGLIQSGAVEFNLAGDEGPPLPVLG